MIKPRFVLSFVAAVLAIFSVLMIVFPDDGFNLPLFGKFSFLSFSDILKNDNNTADISGIEKIKRDPIWLKDSLSLADSLKVFSDDGRDSTRIRYPRNDKSVLNPFFEKLDSLKSQKNTLIRIIHYGDSQIEGDRISGYLRDRLQELFGGSGAGIVPAVQPIAARSVFQSASANWSRFAVFGTIEQKADHNRYGAMLSVCKYSGNSATVRFSKSSIGYPGNKIISNISIYYGQSVENVGVRIISGNETLAADSLETTSGVQKISIPVSGLKDVFTLEFNGQSPEIYGITLDGKNGITVDNIPMRGSSGNRFTWVDKNCMSRMHKLMNVKLVLMEFGGNMMPSINGKKSIDTYKDAFYQQLIYMKEANPDACIITIGPADMSKKINGSMQTYPYLEDVRDALREASFNAGCAYWDMFAAMGGRNSMPEWVKAKPPLAGPDYIHFTPLGAEKVAELFTRALINDYNEFRFLQKIKKMQDNSTALSELK